MQQCSAQKRHESSVWLVSHHQPSGAAAYNRDAYVGQQAGFVGRGAVWKYASAGTGRNTRLIWINLPGSALPMLRNRKDWAWTTRTIRRKVA